MTRTDEALATKIVYLKKNGYIPNIDKESREVQTAIQSFYFCSKSVRRDKNEFNEDPFWFRLTFCNYMVTDKFVRDVNRQYKRFQILNIAKDEF